MKTPKKRICIYTKDIQRITGKGDRSSRQLLSHIRLALNKKKHELISIEDFCSYTGLRLEEVVDFLNE